LIAPELNDVLGRILGDAWSPTDADAEAGAAAERTLASLGVSSAMLIELVLELEAAYGVAIPDELLVAENFATISSVESMMRTLAAQPT
jgi:acyl carrier protein